MDNSSKITKEEIEIIKKAQAGDKLAFNRIFKMYKPFVESLLLKYIKDFDEAKDVTNIVFLKVHDKLSMFVDYSSFGGWLRILTKNTAIDYLRRIKAKNVSFDKESCRLQPDKSLSSSEDDLINRMTYERIIQCFEDLPPINRQINKLFYVENLTVVQISEILNVPTGTIKSVLFRTRKRIRKQFKNM